MNVADFLFPRDLEVTPTKLAKILFIGSCLSEAYVKHFRALNAAIHYEHVLFNNAMDLPARSAQELAAYDLQYIQLPLRSILPDTVVRIADNDKRDTPIVWLELGQLNIDRMLDKAMAYNRQSGLLTIVSTFFVPQVHVSPSLNDIRSQNDLFLVIHHLNNYLAEKVRNFRNSFIADVDMIATSLGKRYFLDDVTGFYTHGAVHYPDWSEGNRLEKVPPFIETYENRVDQFWSAALRQIESIYRIVNQIDQVKVVIFDLDNTLWRGQLVEDYQPGTKWPHYHGWPLGIWEAVQHLRWRGIATAIASKNDHDVVVAKWNDAVTQPFVALEDFIVPQINWQPKPESVVKILEALSLTSKSAVFVDDSPLEREAVKAALPGMRVIGSNPFLTRRILLWSAETQIPHRSEESRRRENMLQKQILREGQRHAMSNDEFLQSLQTNLSIWELNDTLHHSFQRVFELVNKTNQFNTTGKRWTLSDFQAFWRSGGQVFAFSVTDRFADYGIVGAVFIRGFFISQYIMSCRVLGMGIETAALDNLINHIRFVRHHREDSPGDFVGEIVPTPVNMPCREVFTNSNFIADNFHAGRFCLPEGTKPAQPRHVTVKFQPSHLPSIPLAEVSASEPT